MRGLEPPLSELLGGIDRHRTCNLPDANRLLSQLSYDPKVFRTTTR